MGILSCWHGWRAVVLAWGMACLGPAADLSAATLDSMGKTEQAALSRIKHPPPIIACETIRSRAG